MTFDFIGFAKTEWQQFISSKMVKAILAIETIAVLAFVHDVVAGTQPLTVDSLKSWAIVQGGLLIALLNRHTQAGIEAKLDGQVDPAIVKGVEEVANAKLVAVVKTQNPALGKALEDHINDAEPVIADVPVVVVKKPDAIG